MYSFTVSLGAGSPGGSSAPARVWSSLATSSDTADWWNPMAVAVVFGLAFATILTLVVVPTMYSLLDSMVSRVWGAPLTHNGQEHTGAAHPAIPA